MTVLLRSRRNGLSLMPGRQALHSQVPHRHRQRDRESPPAGPTPASAVAQAVGIYSFSLLVADSHRTTKYKFGDQPRGIYDV